MRGLHDVEREGDEDVFERRGDRLDLREGKLALQLLDSGCIHERVDGPAKDRRLANSVARSQGRESRRRVRDIDLNPRSSCRIRRRQTLKFFDRSQCNEFRKVDVTDSAAALGLIHVMRGDKECNALSGELEE